MKQKAEEIVGNETYLYLQARMIYRYIVNTLRYSHAPHIDPEVRVSPNPPTSSGPASATAEARACILPHSAARSASLAGAVGGSQPVLVL